MEQTLQMFTVYIRRANLSSNSPGTCAWDLAQEVEEGDAMPIKARRSAQQSAALTASDLKIGRFWQRT
jgi:hypothetical protein